MRLPQRVVVDHDVDRREVQGPRGSQPTRTNSPKSSVWREVESCCDLSSDIRGGFSRGVPPLPIPNRAVKPARADGTDTPVGRVGRRRTSGSPDILSMSGLLFFTFSCILPMLSQGLCVTEKLHVRSCAPIDDTCCRYRCSIAPFAPLWQPLYGFSSPIIYFQ